MGSRRTSRECAMQILYTMDVCRMPKKEAEESFWQTKTYSNDVVSFANELVDGTSGNLNEIDNILMEIAENWELNRMAGVDKAILRIASYELIYTPKTPSNAVINEAIELAKSFSTDDSGKFVNGILDKVKKSQKNKI
ncbi:MAG: transcription antitermination factor NusB [Elusimicrobia bacterium]|nr:transcription antitermination factor NusB [Elusimicrobiota bacterium]